jgi:hypothetical protein
MLNENMEEPFQNSKKKDLTNVEPSYLNKYKETKKRSAK